MPAARLPRIGPAFRPILRAGCPRPAGMKKRWRHLSASIDPPASAGTGRHRHAPGSATPADRRLRPPATIYYCFQVVLEYRFISCCPPSPPSTRQWSLPFTCRQCGWPRRLPCRWSGWLLTAKFLAAVGRSTRRCGSQFSRRSPILLAGVASPARGSGWMSTAPGPGPKRGSPSC